MIELVKRYYNNWIVDFLGKKGVSPNFLSVMRLFFSGIVLGLVLWTSWKNLSLTLFLTGALTDKIDGDLARRWDRKTRLGKFLDPFVDKALYVPVLFVLAKGVLFNWLLWSLVALSCVLVVIGLLKFVIENLPYAGGSNWGGKIKYGLQVVVLIPSLFYIRSFSLLPNIIGIIVLLLGLASISIHLLKQPPKS